MIKLKRIYEKAEPSDGFRILVDRLWPRGVSKEKAMLNLWLKEIAPSDNLRKWFAHDVEKWASFQKKYQDEIKANKKVLGELQDIIKTEKKVTFLYGSKDQEHNEAVVLKEFLETNNSN